MDTGEGPLDQFPRVRSRLRLAPAIEEAAEAPQEEVPAATGRVDHPQVFEAELLHRRVERPVEDELLDEFRRLQQGVFLPRRLRKVLVQIAQEPGVPRVVGKVMHQPARFRLDPLEEAQEGLRRVAAEPAAVLVDRVVRPEDVPPTGEFRQSVEDRQEILPVGVGRVLGEIEFVLVPRAAETLVRAGNPRRVDQAVVLQESGEDATEDPRHGNLRDRIRPPRLERQGRPLGLPRGVVLGTDCLAYLRDFIAPGAEVGLQLPQQSL